MFVHCYCSHLSYYREFELTLIYPYSHHKSNTHRKKMKHEYEINIRPDLFENELEILC